MIPRRSAPRERQYHARMPHREQAEERPVTIYDVAREAGVAPSTVSRALARPGRVSVATASKVREVAQRLGYLRSRTLPAALQRSQLLAMVVSDIKNPVFTDLVRGADLAAEGAGYTLMVFDSRESMVRERAFERYLTAVDGVILTSPRLPAAGIRMLAKQRPVVVLNRIVGDLPCVLTDGAEGARHAAEHLHELGHTEVTYLAGPAASWTDGVRWRGVQQSAVDLGIRTCRIRAASPTVEGGFRAASHWAANPTTGVIAFNDVMAIGFIVGLRALGLEVPRDVSVVGFDNSQLGTLTTPPLTSIASPLRDQGTTATNTLIAILAGKPVPSDPILLPTRLMPRESTGRSCGVARLRATVARVG